MARRFVAEGYFETPLVQQSCLGTAGCIAEFDLQSNLVIHTKTQIPFLAQNDFNSALAGHGAQGQEHKGHCPDPRGGVRDRA